MKCYKCGNDIEDNLECPFCGYINKEETKKNIRANDSFSLLCIRKAIFPIH